MSAGEKPAAQLRVSAVQADLRWQEAQANLEAFAARFETLPATDLVVLP